MGLLDDAIKEHLDLKRRSGADPTEVERLEREALGPVRRAPQEVDAGILDQEPATRVAYPDEDAGHDWAEPVDDAPPSEERPPEEPLLAEERLSEESLLARAREREREGEPEAPRREPEAPRHHEIAEEWDAHESLYTEQPRVPDGRHEPFPTDEHFPADDRRPAEELLPHEEQPLHGDGPGLEPDAHAPAIPPPAPASPPRPEPPPVEPPLDEPEHLAEETAEYDVEGEHRKERTGDQQHTDEDVLEETPEFLQDTPDHDRLWFEQRPPKDFNFDS
jgi:hypothetical protein